MSQTMRPDLVHTLGVCPTEDRPFANLYGPRMDPPLGMRPNCALEIPLSEYGYNSLKLNTLGSSVMGWKGFPGSNLVISQEPSMYHPQLSHPHWLTDAPKMISPQESDEKPVNRCSLPSSQLGRKGIIGFSLAGTSRISKSPQKLRPHPE
jgi:hypothetical protein